LVQGPVLFGQSESEQQSWQFPSSQVNFEQPPTAQTCMALQVSPTTVHWLLFRHCQQDRPSFDKNGFSGGHTRQESSASGLHILTPFSLASHENFATPEQGFASEHPATQTPLADPVFL
jgi:hypothetical protein